MTEEEFDKLKATLQRAKSIKSRIAKHKQDVIKFTRFLEFYKEKGSPKQVEAMRKILNDKVAKLDNARIDFKQLTILDE